MTSIAASASAIALPGDPGSQGQAPRASVHVESSEDTSVFVGCEFGPDIWGRVEQRNFYVVDTGRKGPDDVSVVIHEDGSAIVTINGQSQTYYPTSENQPDFLRIRVDPDDRVQIEDRRSMADKMLNPRPVQTFEYP